VVGGYRARDSSESQLIETHFTGSPQGQDGVAFFDNSTGNFLRCIFSGNSRSCIGLAGDVSVLVEESEFVGNHNATILHADYPHLPPAEEVGYGPQPVIMEAGPHRLNSEPNARECRKTKYPKFGKIRAAQSMICRL